MIIYNMCSCSPLPGPFSSVKALVKLYFYKPVVHVRHSYANYISALLEGYMWVNSLNRLHNNVK